VRSLRILLRGYLSKGGIRKLSEREGREKGIENSYLRGGKVGSNSQKEPHHCKGSLPIGRVSSPEKKERGKRIFSRGEDKQTNKKEYAKKGELAISRGRIL